jgi:hypothetical protein
MGRAKEIIVKVIPAKIANAFVKKWHYSGKVVNNSILHFGCFLDGQLHGVMSYGSPMNKAAVIGLVDGTQWDGLLELNRMAFDEFLPKNSESRCIAISIGLIKKQAPQVKWVISFILPYSAIDERGAGMYKGEKISIAERLKKRQPRKRSPATSRKQAV